MKRYQPSDSIQPNPTRSASAQLSTQPDPTGLTQLDPATPDLRPDHPSDTTQPDLKPQTRPYQTDPTHLATLTDRQEAAKLL